MLPLAEAWYRKLLVAALVLGVAGGVIALVYSGVTDLGIDRFYGEPTTDVWSGQWWWIPLVAGGAVLVVFLRGRWSVPDKVPGAIAIAKRGWVDPSSALSLVTMIPHEGVYKTLSEKTRVGGWVCDTLTPWLHPKVMELPIFDQEEN
jgi:hypothetical protein